MRTAVQPALQYRAGVDDFLVMAADCRGVQVSLELALSGRIAPLYPSAGGEDGAHRRERGGRGASVSKTVCTPLQSLVRLDGHIRPLLCFGQAPGYLVLASIPSRNRAMPRPSPYR
jgi:hypothetical protein